MCPEGLGNVAWGFNPNDVDLGLIAITNVFENESRTSNKVVASLLELLIRKWVDFRPVGCVLRTNKPLNGARSAPYTATRQKLESRSLDE